MGAYLGETFCFFHVVILLAGSPATSTTIFTTWYYLYVVSCLATHLAQHRDRLRTGWHKTKEGVRSDLLRCDGFVGSKIGLCEYMLPWHPRWRGKRENVSLERRYDSVLGPATAGTVRPTDSDRSIDRPCIDLCALSIIRIKQS